MRSPTAPPTFPPAPSVDAGRPVAALAEGFATPLVRRRTADLVPEPLRPAHSVACWSAMEPTTAELYTELAPKVLGYFRSRGARSPEDLTGDVFVKVAAARDGFRGDRAALRRWVFTIAHNLLVDEYRSAGPRAEQSVPGVPETGSVDELPFDDRLLKALASINEQQREVVVLRTVADLSVKDVAKIIGKRAGAVKMLHARGLEALAAALSEESDTTA